MARRSDQYISDQYIKVHRETKRLLLGMEVDALPIESFKIDRQLDIELFLLPANAFRITCMLVHVCK